MSFKPFKRVFVGSNDSNFSIGGLPKMEHGKEFEVTDEGAMKANILSEQHFDSMFAGLPFERKHSPCELCAKKEPDEAKSMKGGKKEGGE